MRRTRRRRGACSEYGPGRPPLWIAERERLTRYPAELGQRSRRGSRSTSKFTQALIFFCQVSGSIRGKEKEGGMIKEGTIWPKGQYGGPFLLSYILIEPDPYHPLNTQTYRSSERELVYLFNFMGPIILLIKTLWEGVKV